MSTLHLIHRPISGDIIALTAEEATEYLNLPDHKGLEFKVEMAFPAESHVCEAMVDLEETPNPRD